MNNVGFESGLKYWLVFLLAFVLIGYPVQTSIFWGAIAGIVGGYIAYSWMQKSLPDRPTADAPAHSDTLMGRAGRRLQQWRQGQTESDRGTVFGMFRRRRRRTLRDRR